MVGFNANLFLINPNGITFGPNAAVRIEARSFVATTANAIQFGSQGVFSATNPAIPPLLSVNPSALLFNQITAQRPAPIDLRSVSLGVPAGLSLLLVGGDISLKFAQLQASGGRIELTGLSAPGAIGLNVEGDRIRLSIPNEASRSDLSMVSSGVNVGIPNTAFRFGGDIVMQFRNIEILGDDTYQSYLFLELQTWWTPLMVEEGILSSTLREKLRLQMLQWIARYSFERSEMEEISISPLAL